jgi:hypothetical protein
MVMPLIRATSTGSIAFRTTAIPAPAGVTTGDLLVAILSSDENATVTPPAGWTSAGGNTANAVFLNVFTKVANGSEPASYTFTLPAGSTDSAVATILAVQAGSYDTTTPLYGLTVGGSGTAASAHTAPSVTPTVADSLLVSVWANAGSGGGAYTMPGSMTERFDRNDGWVTMAVGTEALTSTTATGTRTATSTTAAGATRSTTWRSVSLLIRGVTSGPGSTDFTGVADGSAWPAPWTRYTTGSSIVDVQGGRGRLVGGGAAAFQSGHQAALPLNTTDFDITYDVTVTNVIESYFNVSVRANGQQANGFPTSGFFLRATIATGNLSFQRWISSGTSFQAVGAAVNPGAWTANVAKRFRLQLIGTALRAKVWDPAATEPSTWNIDITDTALPGALGGVIITYATGTGNTAVTGYVDNFTNNLIPPVTPAVTYPTLPNQVGDPVVLDTTLGGKTVLRYDVVTETGQATGTRNASLFVPSDFTPGETKKLALANHGMDGGGAGWPNDAWKRDLSWRLIDAGYVLIAPSFGTAGVNPNTHGNAMAQTQYARAHAYASARFQVTGTVLLGYSMGGGQVLVELHRQTVPGVRVGYVVSALTDMGNMAGPNSPNASYTKPALLTAYNATEATFPAAAAGYDPMVQPVTVWKDMRIRMNVSTGDTVVPQSVQGIPFRDRVSPAAAELVYINTTGDHNSATQWESAATVATWLDSALTASTTLTRTLTDNAAITDSATAGLTISRTLTDSAAIVDAGATYTIGPGRNLVDNAAITDSATWRMQSQRTLTDRVATSDSATWTMDVPGIQDFQFQLLGQTIPRVVLGRGAEIVVLPDGFDPAYGDLRTQDQNAPQGDYRRFGADKRSPGVWSFEAYVDAPNAEQALGWVDMCAEAWDAEYVRESPGAVMALQYKVAGRLRRIYGRPRNFQAPPGPLIQNGRVPVSMEFHRVEDVSYDDDEQGVLIRMGRSGEVRPSPWRFPLRFPTSVKTVAEPRTEQVLIGGRLRTWLVISIRGPVINPWVQIGQHRWQLTGEVPGGRTAHLSGLPWMQTIYMDDGSFLPETGNGVFRPDMLDPRSRLAHLRFEPGQYAATFGGYDTTGSATAQVRWRNAYRGW